jgi:hypothetical protein
MYGPPQDCKGKSCLLDQTSKRSTDFGIGISRRTAVINQLRAFLLERGMVFAQKSAKRPAKKASPGAGFQAISDVCGFAVYVES